MRKLRNVPAITAEELREILSYDPDTGEFRWKVKRTGGVKCGDVAGYTDLNGYNIIKVKGKLYKSHRLAWMYMYGCFPKDYTDHINGIKTDNRISNLRESNNRENQCNQTRHRSGKLPGCTHRKRTKRRNERWITAISIDGVSKHIGCFSSEEAAHHTYLIWKHNLGL